MIYLLLNNILFDKTTQLWKFRVLHVDNLCSLHTKALLNRFPVSQNKQ